MTARSDADRSTDSLVLLPGLNNTAAVFDGVVQALLPAGIDALALDNPALETVEAIADASLVTLPERFWLAGFSFGGYVALAMLQRAPQRIKGIAMVCTGPGADPPAAQPKRQAALDAVAQGRYFEMIEQQAANAFHPDSLTNTALMQARRAMVQAYGPQRYAAHVRATMARPDRTRLLDGSKPTLVVTASHDTVIPPAGVAAYAAAIPGAQLHTVQGAGHLLPLEQPQGLADLLAKWIQAGGAGIH
ncbi:MAG: alpha/beta hydrolase [Burkholderiaceae bacterium]